VLVPPAARASTSAKFGFAAVCVAMLITACGDDAALTADLDKQLAIARDATTPAGTVLSGGSGPARAGQIVSAGWSFELSGGWDTYVEQTAGILRAAGYEELGATPTSRSFVRHVPGDSYRVQLSRGTSNTTARVAVSFQASPD
jgi:hypothetical protein